MALFAMHKPGLDESNGFMIVSGGGEGVESDAR
jgi:hypothetical protein